MSEKYLGQEQRHRGMRELTFHPLVGLFSELEPPLIPVVHDAGLPLLLRIGLLELLILLPESIDVSNVAEQVCPCAGSGPALS